MVKEGSLEEGSLKGWRVVGEEELPQEKLGAQPLESCIESFWPGQEMGLGNLRELILPPASPVF